MNSGYYFKNSSLCSSVEELEIAIKNKPRHLPYVYLTNNLFQILKNKSHQFAINLFCQDCSTVRIRLMKDRQIRRLSYIIYDDGYETPDWSDCDELTNQDINECGG